MRSYKLRGFSIFCREGVVFSDYHPSSSAISGSRPGRIPLQVLIRPLKASVFDPTHTRASLVLWVEGYLEKEKPCKVILLRPRIHFLTPPLQYISPPALPFHITHMGELAQGSPPPRNPTYARPPHSPFLFWKHKINAQFSPSQAEIFSLTTKIIYHRADVCGRAQDV